MVLQHDYPALSQWDSSFRDTLISHCHPTLVPARNGWERDSALLQEWGNKSQRVLHASSGQSMQTEMSASRPGHTGPQGTHQTNFSAVYVYTAFVNLSLQEHTSCIPGIKCFIASQCIKAQCWKWLHFLATSDLETATELCSFLSKVPPSSKLPLLYLWLVLY